MDITNFVYNAQMDSLAKAYNDVSNACIEVHKALSGIWGEDFANTNTEPLTELAGHFGDYIEKYMGNIAYLGLCIKK